MGRLLKVLQPGIQSWIVDEGRLSYYSEGISRCGAADISSYNLANRLLENEKNTPSIQIFNGGLEVEFLKDCFISLTGVNRDVKLDKNIVLVLNRVYAIKRNQRLKIANGAKGNYLYLGIAGKWMCETWKNSVSPMLNLPNVCANNRLQKQKFVSIIPTIKLRIKTARIKENNYNFNLVRVLKGPEYNKFSITEHDQFLNQTWKISKHSNRMGYRLESKFPMDAKDRGIISSGILEGTIQINSQGQAILLLNESQTAGGYARIAIVRKEDIPLVVQMQSNSSIQFIINESID